MNNPEFQLSQKDINQKKIEVIRELAQEKDLDLLLNIQNLIQGYKHKLTAWEEEQLKVGLKDLENGKKIPHADVMKKVNAIVK